MRLFSSNDYAANGHAIDATQKPLWIADSLRSRPIASVTLVPPPPVDSEQLELVHDPDYVSAVKVGKPRRLAESSTFPWNEGTWISEVASCGGMLAACDAAKSDGVAGSLSVGFHHARRERGRSHCIFNGLALAISAIRRNGVTRVLHIDLDAHCGGGTFSLVGGLDGYHQVDVSLFPTDSYEPTGGSTLDIVQSSDEYLATLSKRLDELSHRMPDFQLCVYYAGMDPHEGSAFGGLPGIDASTLAQRDEIVFSTLRSLGVPVAFGLGGGYLGPGLDRDGLIGLHRRTIELGAAYATEPSDEREPQ